MSSVVQQMVLARAVAQLQLAVLDRIGYDYIWYDVAFIWSIEIVHFI
jgi:hypothetical protein